MLALLLSVVIIGSHVPQSWPALPDLDAYAATIDKGVTAYLADPRPHTAYHVAYATDGDYLGWSAMTWDERPNRTFDTDGIPMMLYGTEFEYNPITVAQYALSLHGKGDRATFLHVARALRDKLMSADGAFRFDYAYPHYLGKLSPGWTSAMAQGQALSVFARAYRLERDVRWLTAGRLALTFLLSGANGLSPSLAAINSSLHGLRFFAEWPTRPPDYTLNGAMFTMLGVYDWSRLGVANWAERAAARSFETTLVTLRRLLPYYDMGRISAYDLSYLTYPGRQPHIVAKYHGVHGYLLHALVSITGDPVFREWEVRWASYF